MAVVHWRKGGISASTISDDSLRLKTRKLFITHHTWNHSGTFSNGFYRAAKLRFSPSLWQLFNYWLPLRLSRSQRTPKCIFTSSREYFLKPFMNDFLAHFHNSLFSKRKSSVLWLRCSRSLFHVFFMLFFALNGNLGDALLLLWAKQLIICSFFRHRYPREKHTRAERAVVV